jgi:hypothetical protein
MRPPLSAYHRAARVIHQIDTSHPRLQCVHERPFIFRIPSFLSAAECAALRAKAATGLDPQGFDDAAGRSRTSTGCALRNEEVPTLRKRLASLASVSEAQMQPLKVSRYAGGERFDIHTDAWRGDLRGHPPRRDDWWADRARREHGVPGAPIPGVNRMVTIFIYLNNVARGGRTRWRWLQHDAKNSHGPRDDFYERPGPGSGRTDVERGAGPDVSVVPQEGLALVHFPSTTASSGGFTDYNAYHEAEPAIDEKWIAQQFVWTHAGLDWRRVLDEASCEPSRRRSSTTL